ncbi:MAG: 30S ribosomal protein S18 [Ureaplasma sp.]|nr:30S ribosomal protein S18 [Ureaplasma sp.]MDE5651687.1 30S ribosomal protein S18 [Ureaplasma sp.]MDE7221996.1 30S ribosomal protein S18 [Ureaplasma sp.]
MANYIKRKPRKKVCPFCAKGIEQIDYKDVEILKKHINSTAKILSARITKCCAKHQRRVSNAIKRARIVALLPFIIE